MRRYIEDRSARPGVRFIRRSPRSRCERCCIKFGISFIVLEAGFFVGLLIARACVSLDGVVVANCRWVVLEGN